ncbi:hypothetical protein PPACK8108_LOCUS24644 [Phakopsora pachyrhizi]|uniref:Uncharacterized protein n=1 Tax=Phakopsora pachyrhizi TaxID=170000 RepID=A0AAV0BQA9_PHAPC|nr:hypothetical protein PPACK8108_LOCUS24644 [Phakopsora pachyrhizi]
MYRFRSEPDLLRLLNKRRNNKDCDGLRDEINHQPSNKSQHSLIISNRLRQHQQLIKSHQLNRKQSQQKFLSDSKSEGMMINSPLLKQDENLNLLTCDNNSPDRPSDNQYNSTIKTKIRNSRLSLSDLSLTRGTQPVVSSSSTNQQRLNNLRLVGLITRLRPSLTRKNTSNSAQQIESEEPTLSNQTINPESINHQSEPTTVSILSSQQMTITSTLTNHKTQTNSQTKPTTIRPQTPDLTNSRPKSPSLINLANLVENWGGGGPSELSYRLPDPPSPISAFEINLSTQSNNSQSRSEMFNVPSSQELSEEWSEPSSLGSLPPSEHPESNRSNAPGPSQPEHLANHQSSSELEIKLKDEESEDDDDVLGDEELYSAQTHLSPKDEILTIYSPSREVLHIIFQDLNGDDLIAEPVKLQSSQKNYHWLRAFTISVLKNERNLTINSSRSSSSSFSSSISEAFHQLLPCSSTPSPVFMSTKSFNNSLDPLQSSQSHSSDIIRPGTSHASEQNPTIAETFLSGSNLRMDARNELKMLKRSQKIRNESVFHKAVVKKLSTSWRAISANVGFPRENETANVLIKKKDKASAKGQKSGGNKNNEMVRIIKEQALKFEKERHGLTSKLVKLTSSNQVLEREVEAEVKYGPYSIPCMPLKCNLMPGVDFGW